MAIHSAIGCTLCKLCSDLTVNQKDLENDG